MTQPHAASKRLHPAFSGSQPRPTFVLVASGPDLPQPEPTADSRQDTASAPTPDRSPRPVEAGAGTVTRRHLALVTDPSQGAPA